MSRISNNSFAVNSSLEQKIDLATVSAAGIPISGTADVDVVGNTVGLATSALQTTGNSSLATLAGTVSGTEVQVDVVTSALPSGAATSANQATANASLSDIDTNTTTTAGNTSSMSSTLTTISGKITQGYDATITSGGNGLQQVVIYGRDTSGNLDACQINNLGELVVTTGSSSATHSGSQANLMNAVSASNGTTSNVITTTSSKDVNIFGSSTGTGGIKVEISADNTNWYSVGFEMFPDSNGQFATSFSATISNYWRIKATETATITATLLHA